MQNENAPWWRPLVSRIVRGNASGEALSFIPMPEDAAIIVDDKPHLTLSQAMLCFQRAAGSRDLSNGFAPLFNALIKGDLSPKIQADAPAHEDSRMAGHIALDLPFWKRVWWPWLANKNPQPSKEWTNWLLCGGIIVPLSQVDEIAKPIAEDSKKRTFEYIRQIQLNREATVRRKFNLFWTTTDTIAWIMTRDQKQVDRIASALSPLSTPGHTLPWETLDKIAEENFDAANSQSPLHKAVDDLAEKLHLGSISAKEWKLEGKLNPLSESDFDEYNFIHGSNSAGLLGGDFTGRTNNYILIRPSDVKKLWPEKNKIEIETNWIPLTKAIFQMEQIGLDQSESWKNLRIWICNGIVSLRASKIEGRFDGDLEPLPLELCQRIAELDGMPWTASFVKVKPPYDRYADLEDDGERPLKISGLAVSRADFESALAITGIQTAEGKTTVPTSVLSDEKLKQPTTTTTALREASEWLRSCFENPDDRRTKGQFWEEAKSQWGKRLSQRSFNNKVWPPLAEEFQRSKPGPKRS